MSNNVDRANNHPRINACSALSTNSESSRDHRVSSRFCSRQWKSVPVSLDVLDNNLVGYNVLQRPTTTNRTPINRSTHAHFVLPFRSTTTNNDQQRNRPRRHTYRHTYHVSRIRAERRSGTIGNNQKTKETVENRNTGAVKDVEPWNQQCPTQTVVITEMTIDPSRSITRTNAQKRNTFTCDLLIRFAVRPCRHDRPLRRRRPAFFVRR